MCSLIAVPLWAGTAAGPQPTAPQVRPLTIRQVVDPSSVFRNQEEIVRFALHGFIEFETLHQLLGYIDEQAARWEFASEKDRKAFADGLLEKGIESRIISMTYQLPHELLVTHTEGELSDAIEKLPAKSGSLLFSGRHWSLDRGTYRGILLRLQEKWKASLNCWSASPSIPGRVLSNWYIIEEGIQLFGATYDSTEHFWQAVKYHPDVRLSDLAEILARIRLVDWGPFLDRLSSDREVYLGQTYTVEFLRVQLTPQKLNWFAGEVKRLEALDRVPVRTLQQRDPSARALRFTALDEKVLWGDLADLFHLIYYFSKLREGQFSGPELASVLDGLVRHRFDFIYLQGYRDGQFAFISEDFQDLMLEIWKIKFLSIQRLREVLQSTAGTRLLHFLNDGDSPDIPIPVYVGFLERIREMALRPH